MGNKGWFGCGCLLFVLILVMVVVGLLVHPLSLRFIANQFLYEDRLVPSDAIFVPLMAEDRKGELYAEAFKEYGRGNGKTIWGEEEQVFGIPASQFIAIMGKAKSVKEDAFRWIQVDGDGLSKARKVKELFAKGHVKRVIIVVPEYASRHFHLLYGQPASGQDTIFLIKPVKVSFFKKEVWWKDAASRALLLREASSIGSYYFQSFKYGG
jgi:hypothetical protein